MKAMAALKPEMEAIQKRYPDDRQKQQQAQMDLFKQHGVSPLSGCLPMLLQMPIWIALYRMLSHAGELHQASFIPGWLDDLTRPDPFYILPVTLMGMMFLQSRLQPATGDLRSDAARAFPSDRPPSEAYKRFPEVQVPPFHYPNPASVKPAKARPMPADPALAAFRKRADLLQDKDDIENLQAAYGYYFDKSMWGEVAALFSKDGTFEYGQRGVYVGAAHIRQGLKLIGAPKRRSGIVSFVMDGLHPHDVGTLLGAEGICVRTGHHCAQPLMDQLGIAGTIRASFAVHSHSGEIDRLAEALMKARQLLG